MKKYIISWVSVLVVCAASTTWAAAPGWYLNFEAGPNWVPDVEVSFDGGAETDVDLNTGFRGSVGVGYNINEFMGVELESGFLYNEGDGADAWLGQVPILANVVFRLENDTPWLPYAGVGAGGVAAILDLEEGDADETDSDFVFAWQFQGGLRYRLSESSSVGIGYKYLGVDSPEFDLGGSNQEFDILHNQSVFASFTWSF